MSLPATLALVEELLAAYNADAARSGPVLPLATLLARLREPMRDATVWAATGTALLRNGFAEPAAAVLAAALQVYPGTAELQYLRGNALRVAQRPDDAERDFRAALALAPAHRQAALSLAFMLREQGRIDAAGDVVLAQWRADHGNAQQTLELLEFLRGSGAHRQARALADAAQARWPTHAQIANIAADLALAFGDFDAARERFRRALGADRAQTSAWLRLSYCRRCSGPDDEDLQLLRAAWGDLSLAPAARTCAGFGLAKLLDDIDACEEAVGVLRAANALAQAQTPWRGSEWRALLDRQLYLPPLPALEPVAGLVPLFIVGMPRTGTTLVATRLARRADVRDRGELNWIASMFDHLAGQGALADRGALQSVAALIARQMRRDDAPALCTIDKNPLNFRHLNLIAALFPNARIVHCRRAPRDTALSLWSQHFAHPDLAFAYDFAAIAEVLRDENRLIEHWRSALALPILDVDYEAMVADPPSQLARIEAFIDLPDAGAAADAPPSADEVVTTASVWQARQPIHDRAVGRWRRYAPFVPELESVVRGTRGEG